MREQIIDLIRQIAPLVAGFITSTLLPALISRWSVSKLRTKIDNVKSTETEREILNKLNSIEDQVLQLRGKRKWRKNTYGFLYLRYSF